MTGLYLFLPAKTSSMQNAFRFISILICSLVILSSCGNKSDNARYISKDAVGVLGINTGSLLEKAAWNSLAGSPIFKELTKKAGGDTTAFDLEKTGIDVSMAYGYAVADQRLSGKSRFMVIIPLKDAEKFKAFLQQQCPKAKLEAKDDLSFATLDDHACIGWDKKTAILAAASSHNQWQADGTPMPQTDNVPLLIESIQKTFALPKDQSLAENEKFANLQKAGHDISFWLNYESLADKLPQEQLGTPGAILASQKKLLKDAFIAGGVKFEKGKITGDATYYYNATVDAIAKASEPKSVNNDLLKRMPGSQLNLMLSYHFNPQGIKALVDSIGVLPLANSGLKEVGLTLDEILNAFSGDFLLALTDFKVATESQSYAMGGTPVNYTKPVPSFKAVLAFKLKDQNAFNKLMQIAVAQQLLTSSSPNVYSIASFATLAANGEYVAISNEAAVASAFVASPGKASFQVPKEVSGNPYGFYADIKNSVHSLPLDLLYGKEDTALFHDGKNLLEAITAYGGKPEDKHSDFHFEITFQNKNENSLVQLINFSKKVAEAEKKEADSIDEVIPDTTAMPVDTAVAL